MRLILATLIFLTLIGIASAEVVVGYDFSNPSQKVVIDIPEASVNYSVLNVNNSLYWNGYPWSNTRWLNIDGSNANTDVDIGFNDFYADRGFFNTTLIIDSDNTGESTLVLYSDNNNYSCINLTEGGNLGFQICNDGSGINRFVISNLYNAYEYIIIDRDDGDITLNNDSIIEGDLIVANNVTAKNATFEYVNITEDLYVKNSTIYLGNVSISSVEYPGGVKVVTFGDSFVNATGYYGDGGFLDNISFVNGTIIAIAYNGTAFWGGNFTGENFSGNFFDFNTSFTDGHMEGRLHWDDDEGTLEVGMKGGEVKLQIGLEQLLHARNDESFDIHNCQPVYVSGATGNNPYIMLSGYDKSFRAAQGTVGLATENISSGRLGYVNTYGYVRDCDTSSWPAGTALYLGENGTLQNTVPTAPNASVFIGIVLRQHANEGIILNLVKPLPLLEDLSNVYGTGNQTEQVIMYNNSTQRWEVTFPYIRKYSSGNFTGSLYTYNSNSSQSDSNSLFQVISDTRGTPQFQVQDGGPEQASFIARSFMIVNQNNSLLNSSQNNICSEWGFTEIDCNTSTTGADFGVTDDAEIKGLVYTKKGFRSYNDQPSAYFVGSKNITTVYSGYNGIYNSTTNYFCDYEFDNFSPLDGWINIVEENSTIEGAWANINSVINSSCVELVNNPSWTESFVNYSWRAVNDPELIFLHDGFGKYYIGNSPRAGFEFNAGNGTGRYAVVIDDTVGANSHRAFQIEQDMNGYSTIAQTIFMTSSKQLVNKDLTMLSMVGDATNMNSSNGVFIDMEIIGQPLTSDGEIDGIRMPPNISHLIHVGSSDDISKVYYNSTDITTNVTTLGELSEIFTTDNSVLYVGNDLNFTVIGITLSTPSSVNILPLYYYCNSSGEWAPLTGVTSTTGGFTSSGTIHFTNPDDRGVCNKQLNGTLFTNTTNYSYIAIQRTRNLIVTPPVVDLISISGATATMFLAEDYMRLSPIDVAPNICDANYLGAIYYDISEDDMCVCKSTGWKVMTDGSACT